LAKPILSGGVASNQSIYEVHSATATNQTRAEGQHPVGTRAYLDDGRVFYYASNGTVALTIGSMLMASALTRATTHDKITLTSSYAAFAAGNSTLTLQEADVDTNDIIENEYKDGYLYFEQPDGGAEGEYHKIKQHSSFDASGSATTGTIEIFDRMRLTCTASDELTLVRNPYDRVIATSTNEEELVIGVAPVAVTASTALATDVTTTSSATTTYFFWAQTWGPAVVPMGTDVSLGVAVVSGTTAKRPLAKPATNTSMAVYGVGMGYAVDEAGDFGMVDLRIRP
jgi:hypothetical protein